MYNVTWDRHNLKVSDGLCVCLNIQKHHIQFVSMCTIYDTNKQSGTRLAPLVHRSPPSYWAKYIP